MVDAQQPRPKRIRPTPPTGVKPKTDKMDEDGDSKVDRYEFCSYMLVNLGKIDQDDVDQVMSLFKHYDLDGSGTITIDDVVQVNTIEGTAPA